MTTGIVIASICELCCMARIFDVILAKSGNPEKYLSELYSKFLYNFVYFKYFF
ncbi:hypothetical protein [Rickettsia endosymbiont of Orchestes rusci]|uniref:hypothetical protein n=1 Tax=Rickettsia endosymbiont of Orchestes rusci TaxID=3066250 RepID=UPI00313B61FC